MKEWFEYELIESIYFERDLSKLCRNEQEEDEVKRFVALNRKKGDGIGRTGLKKIRIPLRGKGTRGGGRIIYYFTEEEDSYIFYLFIYSKANQEDLTPREEKLLENALRVFISERNEGKRRNK